MKRRKILPRVNGDHDDDDCSLRNSEICNKMCLRMKNDVGRARKRVLEAASLVRKTPLSGIDFMRNWSIWLIALMSNLVRKPIKAAGVTLKQLTISS